MTTIKHEENIHIYNTNSPLLFALLATRPPCSFTIARSPLYDPLTLGIHIPLGHPPWSTGIRIASPDSTPAPLSTNQNAHFNLTFFPFPFLRSSSQRIFLLSSLVQVLLLEGWYALLFPLFLCARCALCACARAHVALSVLSLFSCVFFPFFLSIFAADCGLPWSRCQVLPSPRSPG